MSIEFFQQFATQTLESLQSHVPSQESLMNFSTQGFELLNNMTQAVHEYTEETAESAGIDPTTLYAGAALLTAASALTAVTLSRSKPQVKREDFSDYFKNIGDDLDRIKPQRQTGALLTSKKKVATDSLVQGWLKQHGRERSDKLATTWNIAYQGQGFVSQQKIDREYVTKLILEKLGLPKDGWIHTEAQDTIYQSAYEKYVLNPPSKGAKI